MKNNLIRLFVVTLAFAGFSASTISAKTATAKSNVISVMPTPLCSPGSGDYCGME